MKFQKSQACCRRKEGSGRTPIEGWVMKKKERDKQRDFQRKFKEGKDSERME